MKFNFVPTFPKPKLGYADELLCKRCQNNDSCSAACADVCAHPCELYEVLEEMGWGNVVIR
jgi:hypothetical protein